MTCTKDSGADSPLHGYRQLEKADHVSDQRTRSTDLLSQLFLGYAELLHKLLIRRGFFQRIQLDAVNVLQQRVAQHLVVCGLADDGGNYFETR